MLLGFWEKAPSHTYQPFNILLCIYAIFLAVSIRKPAWYYIAMYNQVAGNVSLVWEMYVFNQPFYYFPKPSHLILYVFVILGNHLQKIFYCDIYES